MRDPKVQEHLDRALSEMTTLFTQATEIIEQIPPGNRKPGTKLAEELAEQRGLKGQAIYAILKTLLFDNFPGIRNDKGAYGGLYRLTVEDIQKANQPKIEEKK